VSEIVYTYNTCNGGISYCSKSSSLLEDTFDKLEIRVKIMTVIIDNEKNAINAVG